MSFFKKLFKETGIKDVVTLFHAPSSPASTRVHTILKQAAAQSSSHATEDQASDHSKQSKLENMEFTLEVTEEPPTSGQLSSILEYLGPSNAGTVVAEASGTTDALQIFRKSPTKFQRPVTVDWNNGRAVVGDNESEILQLLKKPSQA